MHQDPVRVSQLHWTRVFPLLRLFQSAALGCGLSTLLLSWVCLLVSWSGAGLANRLLSDGSITAVCEFPWQEYARLQGTIDHRFAEPLDLRTVPLLPAPLNSLQASSSQALFDGRFPFPLGPARQVPWLLSLDLTVWNALVLSFFATAIARCVASSFCTQSRSGVFRSLRYAIRHLRDALLATGLALAIPGFLYGMLRCTELLSRFGAVGELLVSISWGFVFCLSAGLVLVYVTAGVAWLLSLSAVGTDGCTGADALSRSLSYVLTHLLWSACGLLIVALTALAVRVLSQAMIDVGFDVLPVGVSSVSNGVFRRTWTFAIELIPHAAQLSVFLAGMTILYVLLRQKEDGISPEELDGAVPPATSSNRDD